MKNRIMWFWVAFTALLAGACTPDKADDLSGGAVPLAADLKITIEVDQTTNFVTFKLDNEGMVPMWIFSGSETLTTNPCQRRYRRAGTYTVEVKAYNRNGMSDGSVIKEFTLDNDYSATNPLYGAGSKAWVIDASTDGHFGCGESVDNPTGWYAAAANEKAGKGLYDNVLTFNADGTYKFETGGGNIFVNAGVTLIGAEYNTNGEDFSMPWDDYTSTYEYSATTLTFPQQSPAYTVVGYVPNDAYLNGSQLELTIKSLSDEMMELVWYSATANGGGPIAWYMRYIPRDGATTSDPLFGSGSKTWKIANTEIGHLGCGPSIESPVEWYCAAADDKAGKGIYDDRVTFSEDGKYVYDPGEDGLTFINAGVTRFNTGGYVEDFDMENTRQETTYTIDDEYTTLSFPAHTFLPYIAHDEMFDTPTFTVKELTADKLVLVWYTATGNGGSSIAWQMILVPEDYEPGEPEEPEFNKGAELDPAEYKEFLAGSWTWESTSFQHFGCGESIANPTNWWPAPAGAKDGCSMYDDVMTFGADGSYTFDPTDGMTYRNAGVTTYTGAVVDSPLGDDFRVEAEKQTSTYTYSATSDAGVPCFTLPAGILFSYIANDDQLGDFRTYYITAMWENCIDISWYTPTGNGGGPIAWRYRLKRIK